MNGARETDEISARMAERGGEDRREGRAVRPFAEV
jgi:hypothetical protein